MEITEEMRNDPAILVLQEPVKRGENESPITFLKFRAPKGKDIRRWPSKPGMNDLLKMAGKLSLQPDSVFDEMCVKDIEAVADFVGEFF